MGNVIKFGGLALTKSPTQILKILKKEKNIIIVSALGRQGDCYATATLLQIFNKLSSKDQDRLVAMGEIIAAYLYKQFFQEHNIKTLVLEDSGIITDDNYSNANILKVNNRSLLSYLNEVDHIIIPGFIARNQAGNITTLGRGGSDLSAVAIAKSLNKNEVTLYKDVAGVFAYIKEKDFIHRHLSYQQMATIIKQGAGIIQEKALLYAQEKNVIINIADINNDKIGTIISEKPSNYKILLGVKAEETLTLIGQFSDEDVKDITWKLANSRLIIKQIRKEKGNIIITATENLLNNIFSLLFYYLKC